MSSTWIVIYILRVAVDWEAPAGKSSFLTGVTLAGVKVGNMAGPMPESKGFSGGVTA